jgi:TrmH family RNA methyltransferase
VLSKSRVRFVRSLQQEKARSQLRLYVIEGDKMVRDYLEAGRSMEQLYVLDEWWASLPESVRTKAGDVALASPAELAKLSGLATPQSAVAVARQPDDEWDPAELAAGLSFGLEAVRDPGNLGSLLRVAAWFGVQQVLCSPDCVELYNPKVVQATMGALLHVDVHRAPLPPALRVASSRGVPIYGTVLDGASIYDVDLGERGVILLGNESRGLSDEVRSSVTHVVTIPSWTAPAPGKDSLNVAVAAAVVCSEFRRRGRAPAPPGRG